MQRLTRGSWALCLGGLLALTGACGDDDGDNGNGGADAALPDAGTDAGEPDGGEELAHSGTVAITELGFTNEELATFGGANISIGWTDDATATVEPVEGFDNPIGGCLITIYDVAAGDVPPTPTDEGPVTVAGTANGEIACAFDSGRMGYLCQSTDAAASGEVPVGSTAQMELVGVEEQPVYTFPEADFSGVNYGGMWITIAGFADDPANGTFPILANHPSDPTKLIVGNPDLPAVLDAPFTAEAAGSYATAAGAGPIPGGFDFITGENPIEVAKADSDAVSAIDASLEPNGQGFTLEGTQPHAVPTDESAVVFACPGTETDPEAAAYLTGGDCGTSAEAGLQGVIVSGVTTDADVADLAPNAMPAATGQYATFQCSALNKTGAEISADAMAVILGTNPTRIQFNVSYASAALHDGTATKLVVGHTLTGFTDVEAAP